jgi:hypothetical protein
MDGTCRGERVAPLVADKPSIHHFDRFFAQLLRDLVAIAYSRLVEKRRKNSVPSVTMPTASDVGHPTARGPGVRSTLA